MYRCIFILYIHIYLSIYLSIYIYRLDPRSASSGEMLKAKRGAGSRARQTDDAHFLPLAPLSGQPLSTLLRFQRLFPPTLHPAPYTLQPTP